MELYGQDAEARLLSRIIPQLERRIVIDVGAERGGFADELLRAGAEELHAFDPHPANARTLRARFDDDARVTVYECAVSDVDGAGVLNLSSRPNGEPLPFGHTLLDRPDTDEIAWTDAVPVARRSIESLIDAGELPARTGVLKVDTEGHDIAVVRGLGALEADVVMVEHWTDLPRGLGVCPWTTQEMVAELRPRGFTHFAFLVHRAEFVNLKWNDGNVERGAMGNLVFIHDRVLERVLPELLDCAGSLAEGAVAVGRRYANAAGERQAVIDRIEQAASDRLALIHEITREAEERLRLLELTREQLAAASAERDALRGTAGIEQPSG